jgi:hypothetical protein
MGHRFEEAFMHRFIVASTQAFGCLIALCDSDGGFHVARTTAGTLPVGTRLMGNRPALGFGLLLGESIDTVYRVTFESVHCGREQAMKSLQVPLAH